MKARIMLLGVSLAVSSFAIGCGASSPKSFIKRQAKIGCRALKKCDDDAWKATDYDNVRECIDDTTKEDQVEAFVDLCDDFDRKAARKCLAAARKYKRTCDDDDLEFEDCAKVCGAINVEGLELDPTDPDSIADIMERALEMSEERYQDESPGVGLLSE